MKLHELFKGLDMQFENRIPDLSVTQVTDNSSDLEKGGLFVAVKGASQDGHDFIQSAISKGASVIVGEQDLSALPVPYIKVRNSRKALGTIAKNYYGNPSENKIMIGITGTNGKTTTSYLVKHILESSGLSCAVIGTIQNVINGQSVKSVNTTPSSLSLQQLLARSNDKAVVVEVSSHGLAQHRVEGILFDCCLFTNLHPEHLDYHHSMEDYFQTKASLFTMMKPNGKAVINTDNEWGMKLADMLQDNRTSVFGVGHSPENAFCLQKLDTRHSAVTIKEQDSAITLTSSMPGTHNLYNTAMAYSAAKLLGVSSDVILSAVRHFTGVAGRFEVYELPNGATVVVDYAHTPDAIEYCLTTARSSGAGRIFHVFGFRGNRDESKREHMLRLSSELSDRYVLTFDDLNSVSDTDMAETLARLNQLYGNEKGVIIHDRSLAIRQAIDESREQDWIIITGKGHEAYQQSYELPTGSDKETVRHIIDLYKEGGI